MNIEAEFVSPLGVDALVFRRMHGYEELGRLPEYRIDLLRPSKKDPIAAKELLGLRASVAGGVPTGASKPTQLTITKSFSPASTAVGTPGMRGSRCTPVTASMRTLPASA